MPFKSSAAAAAFVAVCFSLSSPIVAHDVKAGAITIEKPWSRATAGQARNGAAYLTLSNGGSEGDRLIRAASPVAGKVELHTHVHENGVMKMRAVEAIAIAPRGVAKLEPSGLHVMLMDLKAPLTVGQKFPLSLTFEKAGTTSVDVTVEPAGSTGASH